VAEVLEECSQSERGRTCAKIKVLYQRDPGSIQGARATRVGHEENLRLGKFAGHVKEVSGGRARIDVGQFDEVALGNVYEVYEDDAEHPLGRMRIVELAPMTALGELIDGPASKLRPGLPVTFLQENDGTSAAPVSDPRDVECPKGSTLQEGHCVVAQGPTPQVPLATMGHLNVVEPNGQVLDVVVDSLVVGKTLLGSWEGSVALGRHSIWLRGPGNVGTPPAAVAVTLDHPASITLVAGELYCSARIEPDPAGALVTVDGEDVGHGVWDGKLRAGKHRFEVTEEGFLSRQRNIDLNSGDRQLLSISLEQDLTSPRWGRRSRSHFLVDVQGAFTVIPRMGGQLDQSCTGACSASLPIGGVAILGGAYQLPQGFGVGLQGGYLAFVHNLARRPGSISGPGLIATDYGTLEDKLTFAGLLLGGTFYYQVGDSWPIMVRLGAGAYLSTVTDVRSGNFVTTASRQPPPNTPYSVPDTTESHGAPYLYFAPEFRVGRRLFEQFEVNAGVQVFALVGLPQPSWTDQNPVLAGPAGQQGEGLGGFGKQTLSGSLVFVVAPGIGARYEF
jgi:hypothetical protein